MSLLQKYLMVMKYYMRECMVLNAHTVMLVNAMLLIAEHASIKFKSLQAMNRWLTQTVRISLQYVQDKTVLPGSVGWRGHRRVHVVLRPLRENG